MGGSQNPKNFSCQCFDCNCCRILVACSLYLRSAILDEINSQVTAAFGDVKSS
jgi:hypothetical protein